MPKILGVPPVRFKLNAIKDGEGYVLAAISLGNRQRFFYNPGAKVEVKYWDKAKGRAKFTAKHPEYVEVNALLNEIENILTQIWEETKGNITPEEYRNEVLYRTGQKERPGDAPPVPTFPEFAAQYVEQRRQSVNAKRNTWKVYGTVANYLAQFAEETGQKLTFEQIDHNFAHAFTNWCYSKPRELSTNYAAKVFSVIRQFMREAERRKLHHNTDYKDFSIKTEKVTQIALTWEELDTLYELDLSDNQRLERVRDLFLIGAYSGLRYSDFSRLEPGHVVEIDGEKMLEIQTQKTGEPVVIPFLPELAAILAKYDYKPPKISSQKMNDYLKELCQFAGLTDLVKVTTTKAGQRIESEVEKWTLVTTHVARRSFATNLYLLGLPAINIMKITGHATERQFMAYIQVSGRLNARHTAAQIAKLTGKRYLKKVD